MCKYGRSRHWSSRASRSEDGRNDGARRGSIPTRLESESTVEELRRPGRENPLVDGLDSISGLNHEEEECDIGGEAWPRRLTRGVDDG